MKNLFCLLSEGRPRAALRSAAGVGRRVGLGVLAMALGLGGVLQTRASTAYGTLNNFDVVNETGVECHGFEIEIEDIHSSDITSTYNYNHYGKPRIIQDDSNPEIPVVIVRYESAKNPDGSWAAYTAVPTNAIAPTDGHRFTNPRINFGGEHFGVGLRRVPTKISYHWLVDNGAGQLVKGPAVMVSTPRFFFSPGQGGARPRVQAVIEPAPVEQHFREFGPATWVKVIRTTSHNNHKVELRDLVSDDPDDPDDRNWRNGEPDEVEMEWHLLQEEFNGENGGANGELFGEPEELPEGDEVVTRRYEFYEYTGPLDRENGEAKAEKVAPDGKHGVGVKTVNGREIDLSTVEVVGKFLGAQMSAFDPDAEVGLTEHLQDGIVGEVYPTRAVVIQGSTPFVSTNWGNLPPGLTFNRVSGELSGTPTEAGVFQFTVRASAGDDPVVQRTYTITIAESAPAAEALPPRFTVDTVASPLEGGTTSGDGVYTNHTTATVTATPAPGFVFVNWTEQGEVVSDDARYTFTNIVNRSLVANFAPAGPSLRYALDPGQGLTLMWATNASGLVLEQSMSLRAPLWTPVTNAVTVVGTNHQVTVAPLQGTRFFRLKGAQ